MTTRAATRAPRTGAFDLPAACTRRAATGGARPYPVAPPQRLTACVGWGLLAGLCLRASLPPLDMPVMLPLGLSLAAFGTAGRGWTEWALVGLFLAWVGMSPVPFGLLAWGPLLSTLSVLVPAVLMAAVFAVAGVVQRIMHGAWQPLALPATWVLGSQAMEALGVPVCLCAGWTSDPDWLRIAAWIGIPGTDGVILLLATGSAHATRLSLAGTGARALRTMGTVWPAAAAMLLLVLPQLVPAPSASKRLRFHAIQPAIPTATFHAAKVSLYHRNLIEARIDRLTASALSRPPGVVVMPEGGNGLFNARLARRRQAIANLLEKREAELLLAGADMTPQGVQFNVVHHVTSAGFGQLVRKAHPVAIAERGLAAGRPRAITTRWGSLGIAICFDAVFADHVRELVRQGAGVLVALSDDASFGLSYLSELHAAYARVRAIEVGRALLFLSNAGPVVATDPQGHPIAVSGITTHPGVMSIELPVTTASTWAMRGGRWLVSWAWLLLIAAHLFVHARVGGAVQPRQPEWNTLKRAALHVPVAALALAGIAAVNELGSTAAARGVRLRDAAAEAMQRAAREPIVDHLSGLFRQHGSTGCGPAALAYALTQMGDQVFEEQLAATLSPASPKGYSLAELARLAEHRGFSAWGYQGGVQALPKVGQPPIIAHLRVGHYVVVLASGADRVSLFDPESGRMAAIPPSDFERAWSGRYLRVATRPHRDALPRN